MQRPVASSGGEGVSSQLCHPVAPGKLAASSSFSSPVIEISVAVASCGACENEAEQLYGEYEEQPGPAGRAARFAAST